MNGIRKKTLKRFIHDFTWFSKNEEVEKIKETMVEMASNFKASVYEDDFEELPKVITKEFVNK